MRAEWDKRLPTNLGDRVSIRVLVLGDVAVGKSSLVDMICSTSGGVSSCTEHHSSSDRTSGCLVSFAHSCVEVGMHPLDVEVEFWEVGGSLAFSTARSVFYQHFDSVLLVYDVSNMKSYRNTVMWLFELCTCTGPPSLRYWDTGGGSGGVHDHDLEHGANKEKERAIFGHLCPVLFVAHKCDLRPAGQPRLSLTKPMPPDRPPLLDRILGGDSIAAWRGSADDMRLADKICNFVFRGNHTEASSKRQSFDFALWKEFVRKTVDGKRRLESQV